jgi:TonB family protein
MTDARTRHSRGLLIVILLAIIFFTLLGLIIVKAGKPRPHASTEAETLTVLPVRIRIRTEPQARAAVVTTASSGERVKLLEDRGAWVRVETADGLSGWAERANLERVLEQTRRMARYDNIRKLPPLKGVATERTALYSGPGIFYPLVGELPDGNDVVVYTRDHDFFAIQHGKAVAYASVDAIDVSAAGAQFEVQTSSASEEPIPPTTTTADGTAEPPQVADTALETAPPVFVPEPEPEPVRDSPPGGVYSAVPPGGTEPEEIDRVVPRYPSAARRAGTEGRVVVRGIVRRDGTIDNVEVIRDLPYGLGDAARQAVSRWRFRPATYRGEPIDVYYTVTVNFRLQ